MPSIDELVKRYHDEYWGDPAFGYKCEDNCSIAQLIRRVIADERERCAKMENDIEETHTLLDYFAREYPTMPTREDGNIESRIAFVLNTHISERFKNGIVFLGKNTAVWLMDAKSEEEARAILGLSLTRRVGDT